MPDTKSTATYILALSLFSLAGALVYFSIKVSEVTQTLPAILEGIEQTSAKIEPVLAEVSGIRDLVPPILEEVRKTRKAIPPILKEVEQIRKQVPPILEEVAATRKQIPDIIKSTDKASDAVTKAALEVAATRKVIPDVLDEVEKTREAIPPMLDKADRIVANAGNIGKDASEDAVTGVFTGIIKAPFKLVGSIGKSITGALGAGVEALSGDDEKMITDFSNELLMSGIVGETHSWVNPENGNKNTVSLIETRTIDGQQCKIVHVEVHSSNNKHIDNNITACLNDESEWELIEKADDDFE